MFEYLLITIIVLWSLYIVFKKVFPSSYTRTFTQLANFCQKQGWQTLAQWLRPAMSVGCGGGCGCKSEDSQNSIQPVKWK